MKHPHLSVSAVCGAIKCLAGAALFAAVSTAALAETKTLYIGMNGGDMEREFKQHVFPEFEKMHDVKIVVVPGNSADILAKAQAFKDKPQMHVMFLDDGVMVRAASMGLCEKLRDDPVLQEVHPSARLRGGMAAGIDIGMTGLAYNTKMFKENGWAPPTSWMDLADPKYKGKVVFQSAAASTFGLHAFLMLNRIHGGNETNVEPGFNAWKGTVGKNVLEYITNSAKIAEMVQTGEAGLFPLTPTAVGRLKKRGIPVEYVQPKEGSVILMVAECVIANNSEPDLSQKLAHYLLSAPAQSRAGEVGSHFPSNTTVKFSEDAKPFLDRFKGYMDSATTLDWEVINVNRPAWNVRWNRVVEQ